MHDFKRNAFSNIYDKVHSFITKYIAGISENRLVDLFNPFTISKRDFDRSGNSCSDDENVYQCHAEHIFNNTETEFCEK